MFYIMKTVSAKIVKENKIYVTNKYLPLSNH